MSEMVKNVEKSVEIEPFHSWKLELEAAIDADQIELVEAVEERDRLQIAHRDAVASKAFVARALSNIPPSRLSGLLAVRVRGHSREQDEIAAELSRASNRVSAIMQRISDTTVALEQLEQVMMPQEQAA